ncbi:hypothetical protein V1224_09140 [Lachnospiraceae bacterium JLR.KK008]
MEEQKKTTNYIKNPLPLPRKHVKPPLDYDFELHPEEMEFDLVDLKEGEDDFDLP